jgi:hypothetical protein
MNKPTLLSYNLKGDRALTIRQLATDLGINVRAVEANEYGQSLLSLLGLEAPGEAANTGEGFKEEMLVMADFPSSLINRFLDAFRQQGIPSVKLKALLTKTNSEWHSLTLHNVLLKEGAAMAQLRAQVQAKRTAEAK